MDFFFQHLAEFILVFLLAAFVKIHNDVLHFIRIGNVVEDELFFFAGCLYLEIAEVEKGGNEAVDVGGDVLDLFQFQLAHFPGEKAFLLDVDDPLISNYPHVEIIIHPDQEKSDPDKHKEQIFQEEKEIGELPVRDVRENRRKNEKAADKHESHGEKDEKLADDIKPVAMKDQKHFFVRFLSSEMIFGKISHFIYFNLLGLKCLLQIYLFRQDPIDLKTNNTGWLFKDFLTSIGSIG